MQAGEHRRSPTTKRKSLIGEYAGCCVDIVLIKTLSARHEAGDQRRPSTLIELLQKLHQLLNVKLEWVKCKVE